MMKKLDYLEEIVEIQENLLDFLDDQSNVEENFDHLKNILEDKKIGEDYHKLKSFLYLLVSISNNHHRFTLFFTKIDRILLYFKDSIKKNYSNAEIFKIFKSNKRILLFLIEEEIMKMDQNIATKIATKKKYITAKYPQYFSPEIHPFTNEHFDITNQDFFYESRKKGENQSFICNLIQDDSVEEFITFVNRHNYYLDSKIEQSIYETNSFLLKNSIENPEKQMYKYLNHKRLKIKNEISLIEYAAFYGSIQIFQYLRMNNASLNKSLWLYAIHGQNAEIIHLLEEDNIKPEDQTYKTILLESIKCHHNDITEYIQNKYLVNEEIVFKGEILDKIIKTYNYNFIQNIIINQEIFYYLCKYDYYILVDSLLKNSQIDINKKNHFNNSNKRISGYKTALFLAIEKENIDIIKLLLTNKQIDVNVLNQINNSESHIYKEETAICLAYEKRNIEIFKLLLTNNNIDVNIHNIIKQKNNDSEKTILFDAVKDRNVEIVKLLLTNEKIDINILSKIDDNCSEKTALFLAVEKNYPEIVKLLLTNTKIDVNAINKDNSYPKVENTALFLASEQKKTEMVKLLLTNDNINVNIPNIMTYEDGKCVKTPLHISAEKCNTEIVKLLLARQDIDVNIKTTYKDYIVRMNEETALHISLNKLDYETIKLLISRKDVDVNIKSYSCVKKNNKIIEEEQTPLYISVGNRDIRSLKLLLTREDIDINAVSICKYSEKNNSYFSQLSIIPKLDIKTPLDLAIKNNDIEIVKFLLKQKNIKISRNNKGKRLIDMTNNKKMKKILKSTCNIKA